MTKPILTNANKNKLIDLAFDTIRPALFEDFNFKSTEQFDAAADYLKELINDFKGDFENEEQS